MRGISCSSFVHRIYIKQDYTALGVLSLTSQLAHLSQFLVGEMFEQRYCLEGGGHRHVMFFGGGRVKISKGVNQTRVVPSCSQLAEPVILLSSNQYSYQLLE